MTIALGLLAGSVIIALVGPRYLRLLLHPRVRAGTALTAWLASIGAVAGSALGGAVLLLMPRNDSVDGLIGMARTCVNTASWSSEPVARYAARLAVAAVVFGLALRVCAVLLRRVVRNRRRTRGHLSLLQVLGDADSHDGAHWWLPGTGPVAYSLGGRGGAVVTGTGVRGLAAPVRSAIVAHEHAHLRGRHHLLVGIVDALAAAGPFVPLLRAAPAPVRVLVELAADEAAVRECGSGPVRQALLAAGDRAATPGSSVPSSSLAMSRDAVVLRLRWLRLRPALHGVARGRRGVAALGAGVPLVPVVGGVAMLVLVYCRAVAGM